MIDALSNTFTKEQLEVLRTSLTEAQEKQNEEPGSIEDTHVKPDEKVCQSEHSENVNFKLSIQLHTWMHTFQPSY